jgi:hypothetical protein
MDTLEAVNELLESIGQTPVSSLENVGLGDVNTARSLLNRVTRAVQLHGFDFNTDDDYELTPDTNGLILVPEGVLRIDPMDKASTLKRRRHPEGQWAIWNTPEQSWVHEDPVTFRIIWAYPFEDMPDSARHYVALSAARKFQKRIIGSDTLDGYNADDEDRAWRALSRDERANRDTNLFTRNPTLAAAIANRRY